jgi:hypothetical protein
MDTGMRWAYFDSLGTDNDLALMRELDGIAYQVG